MLNKPPFQPIFLHPKHWLTWLIAGIIYLTIFLPHFMRIWLAKGLGWLFYTFWHKRRQVVLANLTLCFPDNSPQENKILMKKFFFSLALTLFETALSWWANPNKLKKHVTIHGLENYQKAQAKGKGVILFSAHFTTLEICGAMASFTVQYGGMYRPAKNIVVEYLMLCGRFNRCSPWFTSRDIRGLIRSLRKNETLWYATDQNASRKEGIFVPFFGTLASTNYATSRLAKITQAAVVPFYGIRRADNQHYDVYFEPALTDFPSDSLEQDTTRTNQLIEQWVKKNPAQYLWSHRRFRTRPQITEPSFYDSAKK